MTDNKLQPQDIEQLKLKGIAIEEIETQLNYFKQGFPFLKIINAATTEKGINKIANTEYKEYISEWENYCNSGKAIIKFVPASGAASRMFKDLFEFLDSSNDLPTTNFLKIFFDNISKFAFYNDLNNTCIERYAKSIPELIKSNKQKDIINALLSSDGLNYGNLPKGLLKFHSYEKNVYRTPIEEHMVEGDLYAKGKDNIVNLHFTVSPEHRVLFTQLVKNVLPNYENRFKTKYNISFSEQKAKTDTLAVDLNNDPFKEDGHLLFRPGGHGALLENLNDLDADIVFIKNIDNIIPDKHKDVETKFKKILAGYLIKIQKRIFEYLRVIDSGSYSRETLLEIVYFLQNELNIKNPDTKFLEDAYLTLYLKTKLNRPIRVCGMVENIGEAGGGPFFTVNNDNTISLQILESSQIDINNAKEKDILNNSTHFNPVDLVCAINDYQGNKFDLRRFVDKKTGFISRKSKNGMELKALELPGLWNGSMSDWNTLFVEVPLETFNPVKNVNDLLRKEHQ